MDFFPSIRFIPKHLELKGRLKNWQNFDNFSVFFNKIDISTLKAINFVEKYAKNIKVLSVF